ncbi:MAG TPA: hypothetical protein VJN93_02070 [Candidatus Acidoferrum sp.]|nr:hypothetical protein [Candidatus Acidoferrum sp.]
MTSIASSIQPRPPAMSEALSEREACCNQAKLKRVRGWWFAAREGGEEAGVLEVGR